MAKVGIFLGSGSAAPIYFQAAKFLGRNIVERGHSIVCGASGSGLMGALIDSALAAGGDVLGVLPLDVRAIEVPHPMLRNIRNVESISDRKRLIRELSDILVVLPGGIGTVDEFFEAYALKRIGMFCKPLGLLNFNEFYQPLILQIDKFITEGFAKEKHRELVTYSADANFLLDRLIDEFEHSSY